MERKLIAAAVSSALALPMAAQAVEFAVSGHVNRAVIVVDQDNNPKDGDLQHVDSNASGSRFRLKGSEDIGNGLTAGVNMELGVLSGDKSGTTTRHAAVDLSGAFGKLTLGHTSNAADGMAHADGAFNGGSWLGGVTNWCSYAGSGPACPSNDGTRHETLRYNTPSLGPASIAVSTGDDEYWDAKFSVSGSIGDTAYDFRVGYMDEATAATIGHGDAAQKYKGTVLTTSGAVKFASGTSVGAAWSKAEADPQDAEHSYYYMSLDQSYGDGSIGIYYKKGEYDGTDAKAILGENTEGTLWGIGVGHNIGSGATAYAGYRHVEADGAEDLGLFLAGLRVTFN